MVNDVLTAFFVGAAMGVIIGVIMSAVTVAVRNNEDIKLTQVNLPPTPLENLEAAIPYYVYLRDQLPRYSPEWVRLNDQIKELRSVRLRIKLKERESMQNEVHRVISYNEP